MFKQAVALLLLVVCLALAAAKERRELDPDLELKGRTDFVNQAEHEDQSSVPLMRIRRQNSVAQDSVGSFLSELGTQLDKAQKSIESSAKSLADLFNSTPAPKLQILTRRKRQASSSSGAGDVLTFLSELGPQVERAQTSMKLLSQLFGGSSNQQQQQQQPQPLALPAPPQQQSFQGPPLPPQYQPQQPVVAASTPYVPPPPAAPQSSGASAMQLMSQLSELIRSTQANNARLAQNTQQSFQDAGQQVAAPAQNAQTGISAALVEIGQGLKRIALNNPSLIPDVRHLYQSVSSKLQSASSSVAQAAAPQANSLNGPIVPAKNSEQLADNIAKATIQGLQQPSA